MQTVQVEVAGDAVDCGVVEMAGAEVQLSQYAREIPSAVHSYYPFRH